LLKEGDKFEAYGFDIDKGKMLELRQERGKPLLNVLKQGTLYQYECGKTVKVKTA